MKMKLVCALGFLCSGLLPAAPKPDVLFIAVDDLNDWVGHLKGHPQAKTPNIDKLVARGTAFTNAHCAAPACNPSRAALMSGLRPWQTGIYTNGDPAAPVLKNTLTINRHFLANGYTTLGGGKIYHGFASEGRDDTWTKWAGLFPSINDHDANRNGLDRGHFDWGPAEARQAEMGDYKATDWAIEQLKDPYEWTNLAGEVGVSDIKTRLSGLLPKPETEVKATSKDGKGGDAKEGEGKPKKKGKGKGKK